LNDAIEASWKQGVITVAAAGNHDDDAANYSPSSAPDAVIVGGVDGNYRRFYSSNFGKDVDIFAPGENIESLSCAGDDMYHSVMSGTSMAAPHVSGLVLYIKSVFEGTRTATGALAKLKELQRVGVVMDARGSPNFLAYNGANTNTSSEFIAL
jgi:oryzin